MIKIKNLTIKYDDSRAAISDLTCDIASGDSVALIGANGAGKSTLLSALVGILKPYSGSMEIDGIKVESANINRIRQLAGLIFQRADDQLFCDNASDDIAFGLQNLGLGEDEIAARIREISLHINIESLLTRNCQRLSAGEKKLVSLAGVLVMRPKVLLFDESDAMLDPRGKRELAELLNTLSETKIIATHDLNFAKKTCKKAMLIKDSRLVKFAPIDEILNDTNLLFDCSLA